MLQPTEQWHWQLNADKNQLLLDIDPSMAFSTAYRDKHLTDEISTGCRFNLDDALYYQHMVAQLDDSGRWSTPEVVQIALNATAARRFYKPLMPKSWFFKTNLMAESFADGGEAQPLCHLYSEVDCALFLIIEAGERASVCMLLDPELMLNESRSMSQFDIIKVMNDRCFNTLEVRQLKYA